MGHKVWLITGANRGIGRAIAEFVLSKGEKVVGTARRSESIEEMASMGQDFPGHFAAVHLDMNEEAAIPGAAEAAIGAFGQIDVLVNNAGYGLQGFTEEVTMAQAREQMETNFFGLLGLTQAIIPHMRTRKTGYIVNISSIAGLRGMAGLGQYNASKFAVVGFSEALAQEMKPFGVKVSIVEPGPYKTDWAGPTSLKRSEAMAKKDDSSPYSEQNKRLAAYFDEVDGKQPGDPRQIAEVLYAGSQSEQPPMHMIFGEQAIRIWNERKEMFADEQFISLFPHERNTL